MGEWCSRLGRASRKVYGGWSMLRCDWKGQPRYISAVTTPQEEWGIRDMERYWDFFCSAPSSSVSIFNVLVWIVLNNINLFIHLSVYLSIYLSTYISFCLSIYICLCLPTYLSIYQLHSHSHGVDQVHRNIHCCGNSFCRSAVLSPNTAG